MINQYPILIYSKKITPFMGLLTLVGLSSLLSISPVQAFSVTFENTDFENDFDSWTTTGDTSIQQNFDSLLQYDNKQGFITTGCPDTAFPAGECFDQQDETRTTVRNDDATSFDGVESSGSNHFNFSGNDQVSADGQDATGIFSPNNLQDFLGLDKNTLNIARENGALSGTRTPKEGSAIRQTITVDNYFTLSFNWHFVTNDSNDATFGDQDYALFTIYDTTSNVNSRTIEVLADASNDLVLSNTDFTSGTDFANPLGSGGNGISDYDLYTSATLPAGTYVVGLGVVDVDGVGDTSGLFVDNFQVQEVPFEFSPAAGLALVLGLFGCDRLRRKIKNPR
ncbi:hypothetical protein Xen7305DRAFT_00015310 [Xenococcus sp. PCC 7305]|uniref:PFE-CTERM domain-containing protein n=1 Tax=Xenococcus sp. PCC 7305 TaxID=102125 RepID=UPI0002AC2890|nr:hypothetical protein [Xenococcus sp. PCC 7305]ELS01825.1 hypothetical protein Xen7305DRAFT_00015310 [Xenococcus sp. PCC 7305]